MLLDVVSIWKKSSEKKKSSEQKNRPDLPTLFQIK